jgi:hypothetical protein
MALAKAHALQTFIITRGQFWGMEAPPQCHGSSVGGCGGLSRFNMAMSRINKFSMRAQLS